MYRDYKNRQIGGGPLNQADLWRVSETGAESPDVAFGYQRVAEKL